MSRDRAGRGAGQSRRTGGVPRGRSGNPKARSADKRSPDPQTSSRVTPKAPSNTSVPGKTRSRAVRIAAVAFVALMLLAFVIGCAPYDGDKAAFCADLQRVPSFAELSEQVEGGTDAQAEATLRGAAGEFRAMERQAPRTIRYTVAALGDAADRIAHDLAPGNQPTQVFSVPRDDGTSTEVEIPLDSNRIGAFYRELQDHRGTMSAVYDMATYAREDCGIGGEAVDLGMVGFGAPVEYPEEFYDSGGPVVVPGDDSPQLPGAVPGDDMPGVVIDPPVTTRP